ncbi:hypothetical protein TNCV_2311051 [Trichonephila clavipes]|nr:hypothetical protein TNCV_2311051 [Trichonephila clavipes]
MESFGHSSFPPTALGRQDGEEATSGGRLNESRIAIITPQFEEKDDCACSYRRRRGLGMHAISPDSARCRCDCVVAH